MNGVCGCCGDAGPVESHHIGRRGYSDITIDVCLPCHHYLTITDVHERKWASEHPADHIALGLLDILTRFADSLTLYEYGVMGRDLIRSMENFSGFRYLPSPAETDDVPASVASLTYRFLALGKVLFTFADLCEAYREP